MASTGMMFWAFEHYLKNNPHKGPSGMTNDDITAAADLFYSFNTTSAGSVRPAVDAAFTDCDWPDFGAVADAGGINAVRDTLTTDQARFPESHRGS